MPYSVRKRGEKYRLIKASTGQIAKNKNGTPIDGGGHTDKSKVERQRRAIAANEYR
ncbi:TPA: hypothetical protein ACRZZI_004963 [Vibrio harveyi]